jgi:5-methylcytosine-specific restriction endonuclease McrA
MPTKKEVRHSLYERDGHLCHYCGIQEEDFLGLWGKFYGLPYRGNRLELDRKDAVIIQGKGIKKDNPEYTVDNCVLACALCNMAKSNMFTHEEFHEVGKVLQEIWQKRKRDGRTIKEEKDGKA